MTGAIAGDGDTSLPRTWRPFGARVVGTVAGVALLVVCAAIWIGFGPEVRSRFTGLQRATLVLLGMLAGAVWLALMRSRVSVSGAGVTVVNGYRRRDYAWSQVIAVNLRRGAPWAGMDLSDGTSVSLMGIQGSDGARAVTAVRELRAMIQAHTPSPGD